MSNIAFLIIGESKISGAEKRLVRTFQYLTRTDPTNCYYLFTTKDTYNTLVKFGINIPNSNVKFYRIPFAKKIKNNKRIKIVRKAKQVCPKFYKWIKNYLRFVKLILALLIFCWKKKVRLIIPLQINYGATASVFLKLFFPHLKILINYNDPFFNHVEKGVLKNESLYYWGLKKADLIDFPGHYYYKDLLDKGFKFDNTTISFSPCSFIDSSFKSNMKEDVVVFAHRFTEHTNPGLFIDVIYNLVNKYKIESLFYILGYGELENWIKNRIEDLELKSHVIVEYSTNIREVLAKSKIFLALRNKENYHSQSLLEAMACENAIIATDVGDTKKLVDKTTGFLVNKDISDISQKVIFLLNHENERRNLGRNARNKVLHEHKIETVATYTLSLIKKLNNMK